MLNNEIFFDIFSEPNSFREITTINGTVKTLSKLITAVREIERATSPFAKEVKRFEEKEKLVLGYFESLFLVSCKYFLDLDSDFFVVEAGIGGRLDTTSIINSETVVLTNVGLDHTDILVESIEEILKEKKVVENIHLDLIPKQQKKILTHLMNILLT